MRFGPGSKSDGRLEKLLEGGNQVGFCKHPDRKPSRGSGGPRFKACRARSKKNASWDDDGRGRGHSPPGLADDGPASVSAGSHASCAHPRRGRTESTRGRREPLSRCQPPQRAATIHGRLTCARQFHHGSLAARSVGEIGRIVGSRHFADGSL